MTNIPARRFGSLAAAMVTPMTASGDIEMCIRDRSPSGEVLGLLRIDGTRLRTVLVF